MIFILPWDLRFKYLWCSFCRHISYISGSFLILSRNRCCFCRFISLSTDADFPDLTFFLQRRLAFHLPILVLGGALVGCAFSCSGLNLPDLGFVLSSNLGFVLCVWLIVLLERGGISLSAPAVGTGTQGTCVVLPVCVCVCEGVCVKCALSQPSKISILCHGKIGETDRMNSPTNEL